MGGLTAKEISRLKAPEIQPAILKITRELAANDAERIRLEERRRRLFIRAGQVGISQRTLAPWAQLTNARIAQIVSGESPAKKAAAKKATAKARARSAIKKAPAGSDQPVMAAAAPPLE